MVIDREQKIRPNVAKERLVLQTVAENLKTDQSDRPVVLHTVRESQGSELTIYFEYDVDLIKKLLN